MMLDFSRYVMDRTTRHTFCSLDVCRVAAYCVQNNLCYVSQTPLEEGERELHHRLPRSFGGKDIPQNLVMLNRTVHLMVHAEPKQFYQLFERFPLTTPQMKLLNQLRYEAHRTPIDLNTITIPKS